MRDLQHARSALTFIQEDVEWETKYSLAELRRFQCYEASLVVSYARPFWKGTSHIKALSFGALGIKLPPFTRAIHEDLLSKRNKVFAHSSSRMDQSQLGAPQGACFTDLWMDVLLSLSSDETHCTSSSVNPARLQTQCYSGTPKECSFEGLTAFQRQTFDFLKPTVRGRM